MQTRHKGLAFVQEVKVILQGLGNETEGPGFLIKHIAKYIEGKKIIVPVQCHKDFFGVFDLISWHPEHGFAFHQVSIDEKRQEKINALIEKGVNGNVWGRCHQGNSIMYRIYHVKNEKVTEGEIYYLSEFKKKEKK